MAVRGAVLDYHLKVSLFTGLLNVARLSRHLKSLWLEKLRQVASQTVCWLMVGVQGSNNVWCALEVIDQRLFVTAGLVEHNRAGIKLKLGSGRLYIPKGCCYPTVNLLRGVSGRLPTGIRRTGLKRGKLRFHFPGMHHWTTAFCQNKAGEPNRVGIKLKLGCGRRFALSIISLWGLTTLSELLWIGATPRIFLMPTLA